MELDIKIAPDGSVELHIKGVKGKACTEMAELFKKLMGKQTSRKLTGEYYEPESHASRDIQSS